MKTSVGESPTTSQATHRATSTVRSSPQIASYDGRESPGTITHASPLTMGIRKVVEETILDIARDEGIASRAAFSQSRLEWMIRDRRAYPSHGKNKRKQTGLLEQLLESRLHLFA